MIGLSVLFGGHKNHASFKLSSENSSCPTPEYLLIKVICGLTGKRQWAGFFDYWGV
jgi:hypothetical protein